MANKKVQPKKKIKTLDEFAAAIHRDYTSLRGEMIAGFKDIRSEMATKKDLEQFATKADLNLLRSEMGIGFRNIHDDLRIINEVMVSKADSSH